MRAKKTRAAQEGAGKPPEGVKRPQEKSWGHSLKRARGRALPSRMQARRPWESPDRSVLQQLEISTWAEAPLPAVVSHILGHHHPFTYRQLRRLEHLMAQVVDQHGRDFLQLVELQVQFLALSDQLTTHMIREEQMLFPYILRLEAAAEGGERLARPVFGSVREPIDVLMVEHGGMKATLGKIRAKGSSCHVPLEDSAGWKALSRGLKTLEHDFHRHVQLEDTIVFPRAVSAESSDRYLVEV